jgi:PST family polysaccharide transporter
MGMEDLGQKEIPAELLKRKAVTSAFSVAGGNMLVQLISSIGGIILARILIPSMFGIFAIVNFVVTFIILFGELGLGAALIQRKEELSHEDLKTAFSVQQIFSFFLMVVIFFISPKIVSWYNLEESIRWLLVMLSLSIFLATFKCVPAALLQRKMQFNRLVICEIADIFFFQFVAILLAYLGYGVWSFIWGVLTGSLVSTILFYILSPWKISYGINKEAAKNLIKFGIPYQAHGLVNIGKNAVVPLVVGKISGASGVGYFNWALNFSVLSMFFTRIISRVTFPAFSRIQHDRVLLKKGIEKSIRIGAILFFPILAMSVAFAKPTIHYLYTDKWFPALGAFYLLAISIILTGPTGNTFSNAFYAVGKPYWVLKMDILFLILNFALGIPLVLRFGFEGMAIVKIIVSYSTLLILIYLMSKIVKVKVFGNMLSFLFPSILVGAFFYIYEPFLVKNFFTFLLWGIVGGVLCFLATYLFNPQTVKEEIKDLINTIFKKNDA